MVVSLDVVCKNGVFCGLWGKLFLPPNFPENSWASPAHLQIRPSTPHSITSCADSTLLSWLQGSSIDIIISRSSTEMVQFSEETKVGSSVDGNVLSLSSPANQPFWTPGANLQGHWRFESRYPLVIPPSGEASSFWLQYWRFFYAVAICLWSSIWVCNSLLKS